MKRFLMSYSCGKDSTLALYRMIQAGYEPAGLLVTVNEKEGNSWFHGVPRELLEQYSEAMDIPLLLVPSQGTDYAETFTAALRAGKERGIEICAFGDIDLDAHREWCTSRCIEAGVEAVFPLWQEDREKLTYEFIDRGFKTMIKIVNLEHLPLRFLEKTLTKDVVTDIKNCGADPCGENGEYHTFVYDGPLFKNPIPFAVKENRIKDRYGFLDIQSL